MSYGKEIGDFESLGKKLSNMSMGDWMCFLRDFGIKDKGKISVKVLMDIFKLKARGRDEIGFEEFKDILKPVAEAMAVNIPFLKTPEQKLESFYYFLDLTDPKIQQRMRQAAPPFRGKGPVIAPTPKEREIELEQREYRERMSQKMVTPDNREKSAQWESSGGAAQIGFHPAGEGPHLPNGSRQADHL